MRYKLSSSHSPPSHRGRGAGGMLSGVSASKTYTVPLAVSAVVDDFHHSHVDNPISGNAHISISVSTLNLESFSSYAPHICNPQNTCPKLRLFKYRRIPNISTAAESNPLRIKAPLVNNEKS